MDVEQRLLVHRNDVEFHGRRVHRCPGHKWHGHRGTDRFGQRRLHAELLGRRRHGIGDYPYGDGKSSILSTLSPSGITTIGLTLDPIEHGGNPYGLTIAPTTAGLITAGDLIVCNFNDGATNTQGLGTTIVGLHPTAGATPYRIADSPLLQGCNSLTMLSDDSISAAAYSANQNPLIAPNGTVNTPFSADTFARPWGQAYASASGQSGSAALYISNADGSIDRITLSGDAQNTFTQIASGFCASGAPGGIYAPAGLTYDASNDTLYIVDTSSYSVVAFANVSSIGADGIVVQDNAVPRLLRRRRYRPSAAPQRPRRAQLPTVAR